MTRVRPVFISIAIWAVVVLLLPWFGPLLEQAATWYGNYWEWVMSR